MVSNDVAAVPDAHRLVRIGRRDHHLVYKKGCRSPRPTRLPSDLGSPNWWLPNPRPTLRSNLSLYTSLPILYPNATSSEVIDPSTPQHVDAQKQQEDNGYVAI